MAATTKTGARFKTHSDLLELYWNEIRDNEPLTREEEVELFARVRTGDGEAVSALVQANLRFVVSVAREYCPEDGAALMDLIAEGNLGLMRAIETFDETRGFKFITYAVWWIRQAMRRNLNAHFKAARLPTSHIADLQAMERHAAALSQELGRSPTHEEVAERVELGAERLHNAFEASLPDVYLDAPLTADGDATTMEVFAADATAPEPDLDRAMALQKLREGLSALSEREHHIVESYFGLNGAEAHTLEEIGQELGVTRERVRQLRNRALDKMRGQFGDLLVELSAN